MSGHDYKNQYFNTGRLIQESVGVRPTLYADSRDDLTALPEDLRDDGMIVYVAGDRSTWMFSASSTASDTTENLVLTPDVGDGRWLRADSAVHLKLAISSDLADGATLFTVPTGFRLELARLYWEVTTAFEGGTSSTIGVSSDNEDHNTQGDLLGGASGDDDTTLAGGITGGTIGASFGSNGVVVLEAGDVIRYDEITSAFSSGEGFVHVHARVIS